MKVFLLIFIVGFISKNVFSTEKQAIWPIQNSNPGTGIIYQPNDNIDDEFNYDNLIITAPQNSNIVSPVSGTITFVSYRYLWSLSFTSVLSKSYSGSDNDEDYRIEMAKKYNNQNKNIIDYHFINTLIGIKTNGRGVIYLSGIINPKKFIVGEKIEQGDFIGKIGYSYHKISEPSIIISRSINAKPADPMSIFGLQSTFNEYKPLHTKSRDELTHDELIEDFKIFRESLEEGHPGLYDYIRKDSLDLIFNQTQELLTEQKTIEEFYRLLWNIVLNIHDCHTNVSNPLDNGQSKLSIHPPILLGVQSDTIIVIQAIPDYISYVGKKVKGIDNVQANKIIQKIRKAMNAHVDGYVQSGIDYKMLKYFWFFYEQYIQKDQGDTLKVDFYDGECKNFTCSNYSLEEYIPNFHQNPQKGNVEMKYINDRIPYININSFNLTEKNMQDIIKFIKTITDKKYNNLIIDLRNNGGGNSNNLFTYLAIEPYKTKTICKVNKTDTYDFFKYTDNYNGISGMYLDYTVKKDDGYYYPVSETKYNMPNDSVNYTGELYVLVNSFSKSESSNFAGLVKKNKRGLIIGQETGGVYYQLNAVNFANLILPNSQIKVRIPLVKIIIDSDEIPGIPWGRGVIPDIEIPLTIDEFTQEEDVFLKAAIKKINDYNETKSNDIEMKSNITGKLIFIISAIVILIVIFWIVLKIRHITMYKNNSRDRGKLKG